LKPDGIVGPETAEVMNVSANKRARQMEANLERMRWMSRTFGHRYIEVNIADFKLSIHEYGHTVLSMDVVVGKPFWDTPVFSDIMRYIVINPAWNIPQTIAWKEIIPEIKTDSEYLLNKNIKIVENLYDVHEINAGTINWDDFTEQNLPYWFRQEPGGMNPLGRIKFMFPNRFNVYLHDTPAKHLFSQSSRALSHGCIRVRRPVALAEYVLNGMPEWTQSEIRDTINSGQTTKVYLPKPVNVHIVYLTSWIDDEGILQFRKDIYERDKRLYTALLSDPSSLN
jgi:murein L,D-transpeptidase YcbB/YkuD